jgi:hypothetical protein
MIRTKCTVDRGYVTAVFKFASGEMRKAEVYAAQLASGLWVGMGDGRVHHDPKPDGRFSCRVVCDTGTRTLTDDQIRRALAVELKLAVRRGRWLLNRHADGGQ